MRATPLAMLGLSVIGGILSCAAPEPARVTTYAGLAALADGTRVVTRCTVSDVLWQHAIANPAGYPEMAYVDFPDGQSVVYSKTPIPAAPCRLELQGKVLVLDAGPREPGSKERTTEWHLVAESWIELP